MPLPMIILAGVGVVLIIVTPALVRLVMGRRRDTVALTRIFQLVGFVLVVGALLLRPYNPDTAAVPPPPDAPVGGGR